MHALKTTKRKLRENIKTYSDEETLTKTLKRSPLPLFNTPPPKPHRTSCMACVTRCQPTPTHHKKFPIHTMRSTYLPYERYAFPMDKNFLLL